MPMPESEDDLAQILAALSKLQEQNPNKAKDKWDKLGVMAQIFSGAVLGVVGLWVTATLNEGRTKAAAESADTQARLQNRQLASQYLGQIAAQSNLDQRVQLMRVLDVAVAPDEAVPIALRYAHPNVAISNLPVAEAATGVLQRLSVQGKTALQILANSKDFQEAQMASALLSGSNNHAFIRLSAIDDFANIQVVTNLGTPQEQSVNVGRQYRFSEDSHWLPLDDKLKRGELNSLYVFVKNGVGGCGIRVQLSAGIQQVDYYLSLNDCPANTSVFWIGIPLQVDGDGEVAVIRPGVTMIGATDWKTCVTGCDIPAPAVARGH